VKCPDCGVKMERVPLLPSKAPFNKRFEDAVGQACESASARQSGAAVRFAREHGARDRLAVSGAMGRHEAQARAAANGCGRDSHGEEAKIPHGGVCNLETGEPLWFGRERKKETLDAFRGI